MRVRRPAPASEDGFSLVETLVSITIVAVVMAAISTFFVQALSGIGRERDAQTAIQLAADAGERVRAMQGSAVATLPTTGNLVVVNRVTFRQNWSVSKCWQALPGGGCGSTVDAVEFYRVAVTVSWDGRGCPDGGCSYVTSTLVSSAPAEPTFVKSIAPPPEVVNPGDQAGDITVPISLQLSSDGGELPVIWSATGLPTGLSVNSAGKLSGTPTVPGTYPVTLTSTDAFGHKGTATLTWVVNKLPVVVNPGTQTTAGGTAVSLTLATTGGTAPMVWAATGLPPGLTLEPTTGVISGILSAAGTYPITVKASDAVGKTASATFTWTVPALAVSNVAARSSEAGSTNTALQMVATGGIAPYTWTQTGLPPGLTLGVTGLISGSPTTIGSYSTTVTVTDTAGTAKSTAAFIWTVVAGPTVTAPTGTRTDAVGATVSVTSTATGGTTPRTWTAANLPPGLAINASTGLITGKPTTGTRYVTTVTVTDPTGASGSATVIWNVPSVALAITQPAAGDYSVPRGTAITFVSAATGGTGYTWAATGLPPGIVVNSSGVWSGKPTTAGKYLGVLTVTDSLGRTAVVQGTWTIT